MRAPWYRPIAYLVLMVFLLADLWLFRLNLGNPKMLSALVSLAILFYVCWGIWLHKMEARLHHSLLIEHILLGLLAGLIFYTQLLF